jgi:hypothetical protein
LKIGLTVYADDPQYALAFKAALTAGFRHFKVVGIPSQAMLDFIGEEAVNACFVPYATSIDADFDSYVGVYADLASAAPKCLGICTPQRIGGLVVSRHPTVIELKLSQIVDAIRSSSHQAIFSLNLEEKRFFNFNDYDYLDISNSDLVDRFMAVDVVDDNAKRIVLTNAMRHDDNAKSLMKNFVKSQLYFKDADVIFLDGAFKPEVNNLRDILVTLKSKMNIKRPSLRGDATRASAKRERRW